MHHAECAATTIQYRLNLPHALHSVSPALSALHASRAAALHPETSAILHPSHCPKCGTYRFSGTYPVGPSRRKKRKQATSPRSKALQTRCHLCGFSIDARASPSLDNSSVSIQLPINLSRSETAPTKETGQESPPVDTPRPIAGTTPTAAHAPVQSLPGPQSHPKSSHTKASALRSMLSRDRQRKVVVAKEDHEGLAAFLKEL